MDKKEFAQKLKDCRSAAGLTQVEMSERMKIPLGTIKKWECSNRECPEYTQILILKELERMKTMKKLNCTTYPSNATITDGEKVISVYYDGDQCDGFTADEYWETIKEEIYDEFGKDIDPMSMTDIEINIMRHLEECCFTSEE